MCIFAGLGLEPGDEVITVSHTFNATVSSILYTGATPVFVDIEPDTYLIDAARIEAAITPRTRAICAGPPVRPRGRHGHDRRASPTATDSTVVEDACQAHGATFRGRRSGSFGHGAFSLYATKNMTTGEGGFITTNDDRLADFIRLYRNQGMRQRYHHEILGYNFRLTDIGAAIGLVQFGKLERNTARRQAIAARYDEALADLPVQLPVTPEGRTHVFHQYTIDVGPARDAIVEELQAAEHRRRDLLPDPGPSPGLRHGARTARRPARHRRGRRPDAVAADVPGPDRIGAGAGRRSGPRLRAAPPRPPRAGNGRAPTAARRNRLGAPATQMPPPDGDRLAVTPRAPGTGRPGRLRVRRSGSGWPASGTMGRNHLRVLSSRARLPARGRRRSRVAAVLDAAVASRGAQGFREPLAMVEEAELDALVIAAPTTAHVPLALAAIERGIPVLVEKPLAGDGRRRRLRIVAASRARGVPVQVGHVERFNPAVLELGRLLEAGWLSTVYAIASRRAGPFPARIRDVGVTVDLATHDVDILSWIAGERPRARVRGTGPADPRGARGPPLRPAPLPVRGDRDARRELADAGQAAPARRHRRGGHVRARLPDPAADLHAGADIDAPPR